jgi:hypothetical protein
MKKLMLLLALLPLKLFSQYIVVPTHFDAEDVAEHISHGDLRHYCEDTVEWVVEKKNGNWVTSYKDKIKAERQFYKVLDKGRFRLSSKTNGGYTFLIAIDDYKDRFKTVLFVKCVVNPYTQKIKTIEIQSAD